MREEHIFGKGNLKAVKDLFLLSNMMHLIHASERLKIDSDGLADPETRSRPDVLTSWTALWHV